MPFAEYQDFFALVADYFLQMYYANGYNGSFNDTYLQ